MPWVMQILVGEEWRAVRPSTHRDPYLYNTKEEASHMLKTCYPDRIMEERLGGKQTARVKEVRLIYSEN